VKRPGDPRSGVSGRLFLTETVAHGIIAVTGDHVSDLVQNNVGLMTLGSFLLI
jgi:hypothetical protein